MKESFVKAIGRGMSLSLQDFVIHMDEESGRVRVRHTVDAKYYHMREYRGDCGGTVRRSACRTARTSPTV